MRLRFGIFIFAVVLLASCRSTDTYSTSEPMTSGGAYGSTSETKVVDIGLAEYRIDIPASLPSGRVTFRVKNWGRLPHSFGIRSASESGGYGTSGPSAQSYDRSLPQPLDSGQSATLEVDLKPGTYTVYCPVGDHVSAHAMMRTVVAQ